MKPAHVILNHLKNHPSFGHLKKIEGYQKLLGLLPKQMANGTRFMYNKNDTLFFVLEHPSLKMEFHYKATLIKGLLKALVAQHPQYASIDANHIKAFATNKPPLRPEAFSSTSLPYAERAQGHFVNLSTSDTLYSLFESIRKTIQCSAKP
jgi:hypothetical protein